MTDGALAPLEVSCSLRGAQSFSCLPLQRYWLLLLLLWAAINRFLWTLLCRSPPKPQLLFLNPDPRGLPAQDGKGASLTQKSALPPNSASWTAAPQTSPLQKFSCHLRTVVLREVNWSGWGEASCFFWPYLPRSSRDQMYTSVHICACVCRCACVSSCSLVRGVNAIQVLSCFFKSTFFVCE